MPTDERARRLNALRLGDVDVEGRMPWSSNATFLAKVTYDGECTQAIYKPHRGERPLWDFPDGLWRREVAAYELSEALGWGLVPETVAREDGPLGEGSLQRFVPADFTQHYFTLLEDEEHHERLKTMALFDLVANNTDRKGGHCLLGLDGCVYAIDNGLCFHPQPKVRTVIWDFAGQSVPEHLRRDLRRLAADGLPAAVTDLLGRPECEALERRVASVAALDRFPKPRGEYPYPWPLV